MIISKKSLKCKQGETNLGSKKLKKFDKIIVTDSQGSGNDGLVDEQKLKLAPMKVDSGID